MSTSWKPTVVKWARNKKLKEKCIRTLRVQISKVAIKQSEHLRRYIFADGRLNSEHDCR